MRTTWSPVEGFALVAAGALFSFVVFKLLAFFVTPPNVVLCFFLAAHPVGVLLAERFYVDRADRAARHFTAALVLSVAAFLVLRALHPGLDPPMRSGGFPLGRLLGFVAVAGISQVPFFLYCGVVELLVLRHARARGGSTARAYAAIVGATACALVLGYLLLPTIGALGLAAIALGASVAVAFGGRTRVVAGCVALSVATACAAYPKLDARFVRAVQPRSPFTAGGQLARGMTESFARWDRQAYTQILSARDVTLGAYDNFVYWDVYRSTRPEQRERERHRPDALIFRALPRSSTVAILGAGGGRQVQQALWVDDTARIDAFEIDRTVVDFFTRVDPSANEGAFVDPRVHAFGVEGRRALAEGSQTYDCIYLPEAGTALGYYRHLVGDPLFLHTREAYETYLSRLKPGGVLATAFARPANPDDVLSHRVERIFHELSLEVRSFEGQQWSLTVAARKDDAAALEVLARAESMAPENGLAAITPSTTPATPTNEAQTSTGDDAGFGVPYFVMRHLHDLRGWFMRMLAVGVALAAVVLALLARRARTEGGTFLRLALAGGLGLGFVLLENAVILAFARSLFNVSDAVILGSAYFLCAALGGALIAERARRSRGLSIALLVGALALAVVALSFTSGPLLLVAALPACVAAGALFPLLLAESSAPLTRFLYAADGVGALLGAVVVFFAPLLLGIRGFGVVALAITIANGVFVFTARPPA